MNCVKKKIWTICLEKWCYFCKVWFHQLLYISLWCCWSYSASSLPLLILLFTWDTPCPAIFLTLMILRLRQKISLGVQTVFFWILESVAFNKVLRRNLPYRSQPWSIDSQDSMHHCRVFIILHTSGVEDCMLQAISWTCISYSAALYPWCFLG